MQSKFILPQPHPLDPASRRALFAHDDLIRNLYSMLMADADTYAAHRKRLAKRWGKRYHRDRVRELGLQLINLIDTFDHLPF
jgi:hypothetical protein